MDSHGLGRRASPVAYKITSNALTHRAGVVFRGTVQNAPWITELITVVVTHTVRRSYPRGIINVDNRYMPCIINCIIQYRVRHSVPILIRRYGD